MSFGKRPKLLAQDGLFEHALKLLGGRAQSSGELREKLRRRAEKVTDADLVIAKLKDLGYLNDRSFAEHYAARRLEGEGFGRARVLSDLRTKRVAPSVAERAVNQTFSEVDEIALIERFLERKYRRQPIAEVLGDPKGLASAYRKLRLAGFTSGNSIRTLKRLAHPAADVEGLESLEDSEPLPGPGEAPEI